MQVLLGHTEVARRGFKGGLKSNGVLCGDKFKLKNYFLNYILSDLHTVNRRFIKMLLIWRDQIDQARVFYHSRLLVELNGISARQ